MFLFLLRSFYFNPRSLAGSDLRIPWRSILSCNFNPRSLAGSDFPHRRFRVLIHISIHAPSRGATQAPPRVRPPDSISIHAPSRGATDVLYRSYVHLLISIHAPSRGATDVLYRSYVHLLISIHAPSRGATVFHSSAFAAARFQSTLPRGERHLSCMYVPPFNYFNPRSLAGSDLFTGPQRKRDTPFQSTLPRGERQSTTEKTA